jgi:hypothetical protein
VASLLLGLALYNTLVSQGYVPYVIRMSQLQHFAWNIFRLGFGMRPDFHKCRYLNNEVTNTGGHYAMWSGHSTVVIVYYDSLQLGAGLIECGDWEMREWGMVQAYTDYPI